MNEQPSHCLNELTRNALTSRSTQIDPSKPSTALIITWEGAPSSEQIDAADICAALEEGFGYKGIQLRLPQTNPEAALLSKVQSLLDSAEPTLNPFVVYYRGHGFIKHGKPFWRLRDHSAATVDWFNIQALLENGKPDTVLTLDCDYGVIPTMTRDGHGESAFRLASTRKSGVKVGKLEIIAAPQRAHNSQQSFSYALVCAFKARQGATFSLNGLLAELHKTPGDTIIHKNLSTAANGGKIKMTPICPLPGKTGSSKLKEEHNQAYHDNLGEQLAPTAENWGEYPWWSTVLPAREGYYKKVIVQPVIWEISDWDANGEIQSLKDALQTHFDYQVEETFVIQDNPNAQQSLEMKIRSYVDKVSSEVLTHNDLLMILYNGHGADGYDYNCNMMWSGGRHSRHRIPINWTKVVHHLDTAPCDVVQILDCCFAATATKSKVGDETNILDHIHQETPEVEYRGKNEILASCGRDNGTAAGRNSSMPLFSEVLCTLALKRRPLSIYSWFHEVDSEVVRRNTRNYQNTQRPRNFENWYFSPSWKCHPQELWPRSIILRPKSAVGFAMGPSSTTSGYINAKIKIEQGRPTDVIYSTE